jgi:predicted esterase
MVEFVDATGRPGPSTWSLGAPPRGTESLPVGGVSWFEATAYCRWRGMSLPTIYHWFRASLPSTDAWIPFNPLLARASNFGGEGPEPVATRGAMGVSGAHDLGGNVREWLSTSSRGNRYLVGGAWSDPIYWLHDSFASSPWRREATEGLRCALFPDGEPPEHLAASLETPEQDFSKEIDPILDAVFETRRSFYDYDNTAPFAASVDASTELEWGATQEWVTINTAYGDRMPIRLHIPTNHEPPFEAIVFFGGGNVLRSSEMEDPQPPLGDLIRSGRVLVEPAYDGTFQRNDGRTHQRIAQGQEELLANWIKDLGRTLDYLEERPDIDHTRVSFLGISLGASLAHDLLPFEPRFKAAILFSGGFSPMAAQQRIEDRIAVASRIQMPILMLGGNSDFNSPITPHQEEYFRAFGTPDEHKFFRVYDAGHWPLPMNDVLRETVDFLDRYAGPS